jgi:hypothetical protein
VPEQPCVYPTTGNACCAAAADGHAANAPNEAMKLRRSMATCATPSLHLSLPKALIAEVLQRAPQMALACKRWRAPWLYRDPQDADHMIKALREAGL